MIDGPRVDGTAHGRSRSPAPCRPGPTWRERFGRLGLDAALAPAIDLAERGLACTARIADKWARAPSAHRGRRPRRVDRYRIPGLERTLRLIAEQGPDVLYRGELAAAIAGATWLSEADLAAHRSEWVEPLRYDYRGVEVCELPPNGQGAAALLALALYDGLEPGLHMQIEAMKLALSRTRTRSCTTGRCPRTSSPQGGWRELRSTLRADAAVDPPPYHAAAWRHDATCAWSTATAPPSRSSRASTRASAPESSRRDRHRPPQPRRVLRREPGHPNALGACEAPVPHDHPGHAAGRAATSWGRSA